MRIYFYLYMRARRGWELGSRPCVMRREASRVVKWGSGIQESTGFSKDIKKSGLLKIGDTELVLVLVLAKWYCW